MSNRRTICLFIVLLALVALPGLTMAQEDTTIDPTTPMTEVEPNNGLDTAQIIWTDGVTGKLAKASDVDYFYLITSGWDAMDLTVTVTRPAGSPLQAVVTLYDEAGSELAEAVCGSVEPCVRARVPSGANAMYIRLDDSRNKGGAKYTYTLTPTFADPYEPNDTPAEAKPYEVGRQIAGLIAPEDVDYFSFQAQAGEEFHVTSSYTTVTILDANGNELHVLPAFNDTLFSLEETGSYFMKVTTDYGAQPYWLQMLRVNRPLLLSFTTAGTLGGVAFEPGDLLLYSTLDGTWEMYFDASDMGLQGNLVAADGYFEILLSFDKPQTLPDLGAIKPQDVLSFYANMTGEETGGWLSWYIDGSDVGLTQASEAIDALGRGVNYRPTISTKGKLAVPGASRQLSAQGNDIVLFFETATGADTQGYWQLDFNGGPLVGQKANLVALQPDWGLSMQELGYFLVFDRPVSINGVVYDVNDIIRCRLSSEGDVCASTKLMWDGAFVGNYVIDALAAPPVELR